MSIHSVVPYQINQVVVAQVEQVLPFGVFVRLPDGTQAYVRRRELTLSGNLDPREVVSEGEDIKAVVIAQAEPGRNLELSVRWAKPDPWDAFAQSFKVRDTVTATVKNLSAKGAFVQVVPGVDGFISLADLAPWSVAQPSDLLWVDDQVDAMITALDQQSRRLRLSIRRQMEHQATVRGVLEFIYTTGTAEEKRPDRGELEPVEDKGTSIDPAVVKRVGCVLVVDDHDEVRGPLVEWLQRLGFAVEGAESAAQALARFKERGYGLALIDLDLSGNDGLGLIHALSEGASDTWMAVMSTPERIAQRSEDLAMLGVVDVFVKPLNLDDILELLVRLGQGRTLGSLSLPATGKDTDGSQSSFQRLAETMRSGLSLTARFEAGLKELVRSARADGGLVFCLDPESQQMSIVAQVGELMLNQEAIHTLGESPVKDVICEKDEVFETVVSLRTRRRFRKLLALLTFESCLGVPISSGGEVHHALFLFHRDPDAFTRYRLRDARAMATLFGVALESQALEQRIQSVSPLLLSGQLAAGFAHEVYNKMSGVEIQVRNLQADCGRLGHGSGCRQPAEPFDFAELGQATDWLLAVALDLKDTVELFQRLLRAGPEEYVDVNEVVRRTAQLLRPTARRHRVRVDTDLTPNLPLIIGSAVRLQQVFANLMLNAVQHTAQKMDQWPGGQGMLQVTTAWEPEEEYPIRVRFIDNGPGIHRQLWESIFALGFSTRPGGTGLGLFIARSLVESMGGQVVVERSAIPVGTNFRVELPEV